MRVCRFTDNLEPAADYYRARYSGFHIYEKTADFLSHALASAERVFEALDTESDVQDAEDPTPMPRIEGRVEFKNVTFGYESHKPVLKEISFAVAPGEMIGLVGQIGAHEELLEKKGEFYRLVRMQQEMNKIIGVK